MERTSSCHFEILRCDGTSCARLGRLHTPHGTVETPVFMPVGTCAAVKSVSPAELEANGVAMILSNAYHLHIRPGEEIVGQSGGLHSFMGWNKPILTDSGGFQVFSLAKTRRVEDGGVEFNSHIDGRRVFMGPRESMAVQRVLGSDIAMAFDECAPYPCSRDYACQAMERTLKWAAVCSRENLSQGQQIFGIVQGGIYADLRRECSERLVEIGFDGYAIGGVSVGEPESSLMESAISSLVALPRAAPRYLMGVGRMRQIVDAVALGVDMFDCVIPTRVARNGSAITRSGRYPLKSSLYKDDPKPIEEGCECEACRSFSRAYLRHLLNSGEILGLRLLTIHNLHRYMCFMRELRESIWSGGFSAFRSKIANTVEKE